MLAAALLTLVLLVWGLGGAVGVFTSDDPAGDAAVAVFCGALAFQLLARRDRAAYGSMFLLAVLGLALYALARVAAGGGLPPILLTFFGLALGFLALALLMPGARRWFGMGMALRAPPRSGTERVLRWAVGVPLYALVGGLAALFAFCGLLYLHDSAVGVRRPYAQQLEPHPDHPELGVEWPMHLVDNPGDLLPNGLDAADVNGDGLPDYVTNYEAEGLIRVAFHPGPALRPGRRWFGVDVGKVRNAESSALGDLDGDGRVDVIGVHGVEGTEIPPGARIWWGALSAGARGHAAWTWREGGDVPASSGGWHFLYVKALDLDGDGDRDIVLGGRAARMAFGSKENLLGQGLEWSGIRWLENPGPETARDLARWKMHALDPGSRSGHGFELADLDGDGDLDLANANSDFDTPEDEENVVWYENPGPGPAIREPWPVYELHRSDEWYAKEQVLIADLDGDGRNDVVAHAPEHLYWFRNLGPGTAAAAQAVREGTATHDAPPAPAFFERITIPKHEAARWRARPLEAADVNGDGRLDLLGALIHRDGALAKDKAAVFWMERQGDDPRAPWTTHVIKWADGFWGLNYVNGEKWDQMIPHDVDGDGDVDLMANVEEYNRLESILAVVWFENPRLPE